MEATTAAGAADAASAQKAEYQSSDQYDPAKPEPAVAALLSPSSASAFNEPSVDISRKASFPNIAPKSTYPSSAAGAPSASADRQSKSRSMTPDSSSASSSDQEIIINKNQKQMSSNDVAGPTVPVSNGASVYMSTSSSNLQVPTEHSKSASLNPAIQGSNASKTIASALPETAAEISDAMPTPDNTTPSKANQKSSTHQAPGLTNPAVPKARLPHDRIGMLEDRIKEDPRGDIEAWLGLIEEQKKRAKLEDARSVYERFLVVFPFAAEVWLSYAQMENEANNRNALDNVLGKSLMQVPYLPLWSAYLDHVRRHNNVTTDTSGTARQTIHQAYELALRQVGLDKDSGRLWQDYILFIKSGPGIIGGSNWQDQQKMDLLRKTYQQAICVPTQATNTLWKEYDGFEMGLNKMTGRKFLQDQSPAYMSARSSYTELQNMMRDLKRTTLPSLPPAPGFQGEAEYVDQLSIWKRWIQWEKDDPLVLKQDDGDAYKARVVFVYKHALMAMRFWPELWCDASEFCFANGMDNEGNEFLIQGVAANPESCLLAFKRADRLELSTVGEEGEEKALRRAAAVREPYDKVLDALYDLITKSKVREEREIARIELESAASSSENQSNGLKETNQQEEEEAQEEALNTKDKQRFAQIDAIKSEQSAQARLLSKTLSHVWIALMRALRRIQGKGGVGVGGARGVFSEARKRGRVTPDVYVQAALIEFHCYDPDTGRKIFERGLKLFQEDEAFALEYIQHLVANNDHTNARVIFETVVTRLSQKPETVPKAKPLYAFFHDFESRYGELTQIVKLEKRMSDLFPEDPSLFIFSKRFVDKGFDPTTIRPIISPSKQTSTKVVPSVETTTHEVQGSSLPNFNSPKRPLPLEDSDTDVDRPRKFIRGESPLKSTGIQRLVQQNTVPQPSQQQPPPPAIVRPPPMPQPYLPPPLPRDVTYLLSIIPKAETYHATKFEPKELVRLIRETNVPNHISQLPPQQQQQQQQPPGRSVPLPGPPPPTQHIPPPPMHISPQPYPQHSSVPPMQHRPGMPPMPQMPPMSYSGFTGQVGAPYVYGR